MKTALAKKLVSQLQAKFPGYPSPVIQEADHWGGSGDMLYVCWEEGPYEWTMMVSNPDDPNHIRIPGVFMEPYNSFVMAVIPDSKL